ncbi:V-type ATP synthase subunit I [Sansalvadorimonas sp. 2012CJ34-2]|uniref:V-type ATP synthase subunit I n=1 Tax=Parendozoicomonas callyspongiae TaxID=2942213 RepID=A0ABT0PI81_9GAMM|nr:V-type ATP synthase subunit I [Sansalvadorimonas sp. 2012CJ34-2]MCL6271043.1 V-type ATP synthase subunit I [Sansalvadorimonas sp. 2012CJ34-2]
MSIKALKKITLYGLSSEKKSLMRGMQDLGCMHLIPLGEAQNGDSELTEPQSAKEALSWLSSCPNKRREARSTGELTADSIVSAVLENKQEHRQAADQRDALVKRIQEVRPWGDFSFPDLTEMADVRLWFYVVPQQEMEAVEALDLPWEIVHKDQKDCYVVVLATEEPEAELLPVKRSHVGQHSLTELEEMLEKAEMTLEDKQGERESLTRWIYIISQAVARFEDEKALSDACKGALEDDQFFLVSGWMPADKESEVRSFVADLPAAVTIEEPTDEDTPPTLLDSPDSTGGGSEAFSFFQVPSYRAWDPGGMVFYSFSLFFAMIMSDAAYCAMFAGIIFMNRGKLGTSVPGRRLMNMGYFMSALGVAWGVMIGSYFGVAPGEDTFLGKLAFVDLNNYDAMMALSIAIGVGHLVIANLMSFWINRSRSTAYAPLGWAVLMTGGLGMYLAKTGYIPASLADVVAPGVMIAGAVLIFLFTSERKITSAGSFALRILDGLKGVYNVTGAFGDILSYMRLFALGLSGASLAMTFNSLAHDALNSSPVTGVLFAGIILLLGHVLNFALCIMSGVVHGMRLNVIEFVNWGMSDEGYPFKAFRKQED